ncbi:hypothetical protein [Neorhizobium galegae]|uniref:hypothetical protein n=1 Tax=Neorhizobium galegae TaxID=399 RepID=UPI0012D3AD73|nr:hypothetical protein [Neorhizobium galegae]
MASSKSGRRFLYVSPIEAPIDIPYPITDVPEENGEIVLPFEQKQSPAHAF